MASPETTAWWRGEKREVRAREASGEERDRLWRMMADAYPDYENTSDEPIGRSGRGSWSQLSLRWTRFPKPGHRSPVWPLFWSGAQEILGRRLGPERGRGRADAGALPFVSRHRLVRIQRHHPDLDGPGGVHQASFDLNGAQGGTGACVNFGTGSCTPRSVVSAPASRP